jgi:preprotein translocase subunit SecD
LAIRRLSHICLPKRSRLHEQQRKVKHEHPVFRRKTEAPRQNAQPHITWPTRPLSHHAGQHVGRPFIVLDNQVISAPVIRGPIVGGSGEISGDFTVQQANDLVVLLRAGALLAKLTIIAEWTVGPGLGEDSIRRGETAAAASAALVALFILVTYGLFGLFAIIAVAVNVIMIFGVLSLLNATLTLPGTAGIVQTVGIAVDSNVSQLRADPRGVPP